MTHATLPRFWTAYNRLPEDVRRHADRKYALLQADPSHPSLHLKRVGRTRGLWSVRVNDSYRALAAEDAQGLVWFWIGPHAEYDRILG